MVAIDLRYFMCTSTVTENERHHTYFAPPPHPRHYNCVELNSTARCKQGSEYIRQKQMQASIPSDSYKGSKPAVYVGVVPGTGDEAVSGASSLSTRLSGSVAKSCCPQF